MALKHVALEEGLSVTDKARWLLAGPDGEISAYRYWQDEITPRLAAETRKAYSIAVAQFIDYLYEAKTFESEQVRPKRARELVEGYKTILELGPRARSHWLRQIVTSLPHKLPVKAASANLKLAAVCDFLEQCEELYQELVEINPSDPALASNPYAEVLGSRDTRITRSSQEIAKIRQNSMLGGVIRNAASKLRQRRQLTVKVETTVVWDDSRKELPVEALPSLLNAANSYRDKALYTLLACGGPRTHEALQVKISALDFDKQQIDLKDFLDGIADTHHERRHKGRSARYVYFWPGYAEIFFHYVTQYLAHERPHLVGNPHDYLFVILQRGPNYGQPYFAASDTARVSSFKRTLKRANLVTTTGTNLGPHSLRHTYGVYMVNHCPWTENTYGVPIPIVMRLMGHTKLASTEQYARAQKYQIDAVLNGVRHLGGNRSLTPTRFREALAKSHLQEAERLLAAVDEQNAISQEKTR